MDEFVELLVDEESSEPMESSLVIYNTFWTGYGLGRLFGLFGLLGLRLAAAVCISRKVKCSVLYGDIGVSSGC